MSQTFHFNPNDETKGMRLDIFLAGEMNQSRAQVQKLIRAGLVTIDGKLPKKPGDPLNRVCDIVVEVIEEAADDTLVSLVEGDIHSLGIEVVADAPEYVVVNKPTGVLVHPTEANEPLTLTRWLAEMYPEIAGVGDDPVRPGIVHRLDREASGLMVIAKNQAMFDFLKEQFQNRTVQKEYIVLVHEVMERDHGTIDFPIDRASEGRMAARPKIDPLSLRHVRFNQGGKEALTEYDVIKRFTRFSLLRVRIHTGRTHQIRVHMLAMNHPVVGDTLYMNRKLNLKRDKELGRLFLHAEKLCFDTRGGERVCFTAPLPENLQAFVSELN